MVNVFGNSMKPREGEKTKLKDFEDREILDQHRGYKNDGIRIFVDRNSSPSETWAIRQFIHMVKESLYLVPRTPPAGGSSPRSTAPVLE